MHKEPYKTYFEVFFLCIVVFLFFFIFTTVFAGDYDSIVMPISCENNNPTSKFQFELLEETSVSSYTWYGQFFEGVPGNSEILGMSLLSTGFNDPLNDGIYYIDNPDGSYNWNPCVYGSINGEGEKFFIAVIPNRFGTGDTTTFKNYFESGTGTPPNQNFGIGLIEKDTTTRIIEILLPEQGTTTATTSVNFSFTFYNKNSNQVNSWNLMLYDKLNATYTFFDYFLPAGESGNVEETVEIKEGIYEATISLFNSSTPDLLRGQSTVSFNVIKNPLELLGIDDFDELGGLATSTCSISNLSGCVQNAMLFLFYPSKNVLDKFGNLKTSIQNKPPFGYVSIYTSQLASLSASSTGSFDLEIEENIQTKIFEPLKTGLNSIIWVCFSFWFLNRIRKQEL